MIKPTAAISDAWIYTYVIQPHLEGVERLNRVWSGREEFLSFDPTTSLSFGTRAVYLLSGLALMIPLVASVVWIAMKTFGHPDQLSDSYLVARNREIVFT